MLENGKIKMLMSIFEAVLIAAVMAGCASNSLQTTSTTSMLLTTPLTITITTQTTTTLVTLPPHH